MDKKHKILFIGFSAKKGGAAKAMSNFAKIAEEKYLVSVVTVDENSSVFDLIYRIIERIILIFEYDRNPIKHSLNLWSNSYVKKCLKYSDADVTNLHWINNGTVSIMAILTLPNNALITLHDEWFYCGTEHAYNIKRNDDSEFIRGYSIFSRSRIGIPLSFLIWKLKYYIVKRRSDIIFTAPSNWILERARRSAILSEHELHLIPNPIDTLVFRPRSRVDVQSFRSEIGVATSDFLIVFGGTGGHVDRLKGGYLFFEALNHLRDFVNCKNVKALLFGSDVEISNNLTGNLECISLGFVSSNDELARIYSSANCVVVPSMVESFGQVAAEACACSAPVVCFETSGLTDIVKDNRTGFTVPPFSAVLLARKIADVMSMDIAILSNIRREARKHIHQEFSFAAVSHKYQRLIEDMVSRNNDSVNRDLER